MGDFKIITMGDFTLEVLHLGPTALMAQVIQVWLHTV